MTNISELVDRLTKATEGSRELDGELHRAFVPEWELNYSLPPYTDSIDAALALCERLLPGTIVDMNQGMGGRNWQVTLTNGPFCIQCGGDTLPLAILIATLKALSQGERS